MDRPKRVMIADDDKAIVDAVQAMLEFGGYEVSYTYDGATLLDLKENFPDLILLDIWMSGTDGRDVCKALKLKELTRDIPVIMISASPDLENSAKEAGAEDFLEKPFDMDDLLDKIGVQLKASSESSIC